MPPKASAEGARDAMHHFQQRRQERMRGTGASTVTESSQRFKFNLPVPTPTASALSSSSAGVVAGSGRVASGARPPSDAYLFSGSTVAPVSAAVGASGSPRRVVRIPAAGSSAILPTPRGSTADVTTSPVPRSALKGGRASEARMAARRDEESRESLEDQFENELPPPDDSFRSEGMGGSPSGGEKSVSFRRPPAASLTASQRSASGAKSAAARESSSTAAKRGEEQSTLFRYTRVGETPQTKRTILLPPQAIPPVKGRKSTARHSSVTVREKEAQKRAREVERGTQKRAREAEKERERQLKEAKKAAAEVKDRNKKRKRAARDEGDFDGDEEDEYEVEFDDEDGEAGPDVTMQENVVIGNRISKGLQKANGLMAKFMRRRVRHAIRLALEDDPEDADAALEGTASAPAGSKRSRSAGDKLTDADVIWSMLDSELKAASTSSASTVASSTLRELRKIVRTLFEGLSIKASERRELIAQLDRARHRKKRVRKEVYEARQEVLQNQEAIERIRQTESDNANKIKSAEEGVSFLSKVKAACAGWV